MKKIFALLLAMLMVFQMVGCVSAPAAEAEAGVEPAEEEVSMSGDVPPAVEKGLLNMRTAASDVVDAIIEEVPQMQPGVVEALPVFDNGFTTGDRDLDLKLQEIIDACTSDGKSYEDNLHDLYRYVRDNHGYRKMALHTADENMEDWLFDNVRIMVEDGVGNCYSFAGLLYCLFRAYGFEEAQMCIGTFCTSPHGWVSAVIDGEDYLFDVETEYASLAPRRMPDHYVNCFWRTHYELKAYSYHLDAAAQPVGVPRAEVEEVGE